MRQTIFRNDFLAGSLDVCRSQSVCKAAGDLQQGIDFCYQVFMFLPSADAGGTDKFVADAYGHPQCAAHAGLFGAGLCHTGDVILEIADGDSTILLRTLAGDAFAGRRSAY